MKLTHNIIIYSIKTVHIFGLILTKGFAIKYALVNFKTINVIKYFINNLKIHCVSFKLIEDGPSRCERQPAMEENNSFVCAFNVGLVSKALLTTTSPFN